MKTLTLLLSIAALTAFGFPSVSDVTISADAAARRVTVNYTLADGPAIITAEFLTNGVPLDAALCACVYGDVNKRVTNGVHELVWLADHSGFNARLDDAAVTARVKAWSLETPPDYLVVGLDGPNDVRYFTSTNALPGGLANDDYRTRYLVMRKIPAAGARRRLGCNPGENGVRSASFDTMVRETARIVTFTNDFWIGVFPVTQGQWKRCWTSVESYIDNPSGFKNRVDADMRPVENLEYTKIRPDTWPTDGHAFSGNTTWIGRLRSLSGVAFDLPTDAQWEYACRAGTSGCYGNGKELKWMNETGSLAEIGWHFNDGGNYTKPVGQLIPNAWGMYDMHGNVFEFCLDRCSGSNMVMSADPVVEPIGAATGDQRIMRGGCFEAGAYMCRSAYRRACDYNTGSNARGFRLICPIELVWEKKEVAE